MPREEYLVNRQRALGFSLKATFSRAARKDLGTGPLFELKSRWKVMVNDLSLQKQAVQAPQDAEGKILELFNDIGPRIWEDSVRRYGWLVMAEVENFDGLYPVNLYFSNLNHRNILWTHFHPLVKTKINNELGLWPVTRPRPSNRKTSTVGEESDFEKLDTQSARHKDLGTVTAPTTIRPPAVQPPEGQQRSDSLIMITSDDDRNDMTNSAGNKDMPQHSSTGSQQNSPSCVAKLKIVAKFIQVCFGAKDGSDWAKISLRSCDKVSHLFSRIDAQIPDSLGPMRTAMIKIVQGKAKKTFRIAKDDEFTFEAWKDFLDGEGVKAGEGGEYDLKPIGYAEMVKMETPR